MRIETDGITLTDEISVLCAQTCGTDAEIICAAKASVDPEESIRVREDLKVNPEKTKEYEGLVNYLMSSRHGSVFEMGWIQHVVTAPIFVWREHMRHRVGWCLSGDSLIWKYNDSHTLRRERLRDLWDKWENGVSDSMGRIRHLPNVKGQTLRVLDEETGLFERGRIGSVFQSGIKELFQIDTFDERYVGLKASKDHRILTIDGWAKVEELGDNEQIAVVGKRNVKEGILSTLRKGIGAWTTSQRNKLIRETDKCYVCNEPFCRDNLVLDHIIPVVLDLTKALDPKNLAPICIRCHKEKTNSEQRHAVRDMRAGTIYAEIKRKPFLVSEEMTYDISMLDKHKNFVANGIVVHNSYSEQSARYRPLKPVFWIPSNKRKLVPVPDPGPRCLKPLPLYDGSEQACGGLLIKVKGGHLQCEACAKEYFYHVPARPLFQEAGPKEMEEVRDGFARIHRVAFTEYEKQLSKGVAAEVARSVLGTGIYSTCWTACNPRSMMNFLSLRTHEPTARYVSRPQAEIEQVAREYEKVFAKNWPITYAAFMKNGRVAP